MFEVVTLGLMLHSHHFEDPEVVASKQMAYAKSSSMCSKYSHCPAQRDPDTGEVFSYTDRTPGVYVIADGLTAAVFRNSYGRLSVFGGYTFQKETPYGVFGATVGVVTGYQYRDHSWVRDGVKYDYRSGFTNAKLMPSGMFSYATPKLFSTDARVRLMYTPRKDVLTVGVEKEF